MLKSILLKTPSFVCLFTLCLLPANTALGQAQENTPAAVHAPAGPAVGQTAAGKPFALTIDNIMRGPGLVGYAPRAVHWQPDSQRVYFDWKMADAPEWKEYAHYVVNVDGSQMRLVGDAELRQAAPTNGDLSRDKRLLVYAEAGDIYIYDNTTGARRQITATTEIESNPRWLPDGKSIAFERQGNLYLLSLDGGLLRQLTDIRPASAAGAATPPAAFAGRRGGGGGGGGGRGGAFGGAGIPPPVAQSGADAAAGGASNGTNAASSQDVLRNDERELFAPLRDRAAERDALAARRREQQLPPQRRPYPLATGQFATNLRVAPDGAHVSLFVFEASEGAKNGVVPAYVTESGYVEENGGRTKVGDAQSRSRVVVLDVATGAAHNVDFTPPPITAEEVKAAGKEGAKAGLKAGPRALDWLNWQWSEDGKQAAVLARARDNKDAWLLGVDPATGRTRILANTHDDAWIGGPDWSAYGFLPDDRHLWFVSERDGWAHLYTVSTDGGTPTQLTRGKFEVSQVRLSQDKTRFYFLSSEASPAERDLYTMPTKGGTPARLMRLSRADEDMWLLSPDEKHLAFVRSTSNRPPELFLAPNPALGSDPSLVSALFIANRPLRTAANSSPAASGGADAQAVQITHSPTPEWLSYNWLAPPIVDFKARDGATVYARIYKPLHWKRGGPAVLFAHGAGYLQNVDNWWSHYDREYMFHHLLRERGYLVLDVDYRGSAGYGRDWRTAIYRHMGGKDLDDMTDAARWLTSAYGVDVRRIGIYGGSYGGFLTLMALFTQPDTFAAGAALRPVTDWAHYNHEYTANILNEPQNDPVAYRRSSPIFLAEGLKGALLICHGMVDDNVYFQDSVRLTERLIELRKENWEIAPYPVESHAFLQPTSWADEYKRILKLFDTNLKSRRE